MSKRVGITGGHGFIGHYVVDELLAQGYEVLVFDHHQSDALHRAWPNGVEVFLGDVRDDVAVTEMAAHVDGIIHLAAVLGTAETINNPRPAAHTNILGSLNVFEAANQYNLPVAYAAVGNAWMRDQGGGTYTITKTCAEDFTKMFNKNRDGRINVVRPVNAYGPCQSVAAPFGSSKVRKVTPAFVCRALSNIPIEVYGDGTQISDMVYVQDVAKVFVHAFKDAEQNKIWDFAVGVGPEVSRTINDVASLIANEASKYTGEAPVEIVHLPMRPGEVPNAVVNADVTTLRAVGIDPDSFTSLENGMSNTIAWYQANKGRTWTPA